MNIIVNTEGISRLSARLAEIIETEGACKCSVAIGEIEGIHFRLEAFSREEKFDEEFDAPLVENICLSSQGGGQ